MFNKIKKYLNMIFNDLSKYTENWLYPSVDPVLLEQNMMNGLYIHQAKKMNLEYKFLGSVLSITDGEKRFLHWNLWTELDSRPVGKICGDKGLCRELLSSANVPQPMGMLFDEDYVKQDVLEYSLSLPNSCVVKPARGTGSGAGVTVNLNNKEDIERAIKKASLFCPAIIVEQFIYGIDYRALVYKGRCISVVERIKAQIVGDGENNIRQLIEKENKQRIKSDNWNLGDPVFMPIRLSRGVKVLLNEQGFNPASVPNDGTVILLSNISNYVNGSTYSEKIQVAHPEIIRIAELSALTVGVKLAGVDIIAEDIKKATCYVNEVNTTPGLEIHYFLDDMALCTDPIEQIFKEYFEC